MTCFPDELVAKTYYEPTAEGVEKSFRERLEELRRLKRRQGMRADRTARSNEEASAPSDADGE